MRILIACAVPVARSAIDRPSTGEVNNPSHMPARVASLLRASTALGSIDSEWIHHDDLDVEATAGVDSVVAILPGDLHVTPRWIDNVPNDVPVVIVTSDPAFAALLLRRYCVHEFVAFDQLETELLPALRDAYGSTTLGRAARALRAVDGISPTLRTWMLGALEAFPPHVTVKESAKRPATVHKGWQGNVGYSTPKEFLRWILIVRAIAVKDERAPWTHVAAGLDVTPDVLARAAIQIGGRRLRSIRPDAGQAIRKQFEAYVADLIARSVR